MDTITAFGEKRKGRRANIIELLFIHGELSIENLSQILDISTSTLRRDIASIGKESIISSNSSVKISSNINHLSIPVYKLPVDMQEARAIANLAVSTIEKGDVIAISGGLICNELALRVKFLSGITVVTNAINVAAELTAIPGIEVVVTGGVLISDSFELVGRRVGLGLDEIHINKYFLGTDGISPGLGITAHYESEAEASREIMSRSDQVTILADSTKFKKPTLSLVAPIDAIDQIITTELVHPEVIDEYTNVGVKTVIAPLHDLITIAKK